MKKNEVQLVERKCSMYESIGDLRLVPILISHLQSILRKALQ